MYVSGPKWYRSTIISMCTVADLDGAPLVYAPNSPYFSQFHGVFWKFWQNCMFAPTWKVGGSKGISPRKKLPKNSLSSPLLALVLALGNYAIVGATLVHCIPWLILLLFPHRKHHSDVWSDEWRQRHESRQYPQGTPGEQRHEHNYRGRHPSCKYNEYNHEREGVRSQCKYHFSFLRRKQIRLRWNVKMI